MLLSPEIPLAQTPERAVVIRIDDFLIMTVFFVWLAKISFSKELALFKKTPLNAPIVAYIFINIFSTVLGVIAGNVEFKVSMFYILKYIEYFMIYFLFINNLQEMKQVKTFMFCFLLTSFFIGIYAYTQIGHVPRPTAPFEGEHAEPNTLAGYLILSLSVAIGLFLHSRSPLMKTLLGALVCFNLYPFLMTLSRGSYFGFAFAYLVFLAITKRGKIFLAVLLMMLLIFFPLIIPKAVVNRVLATFTGVHGFRVGGVAVTLEGSAAARVYNFKFAFMHLKSRPLFGYGVTGLGLIDSQYARVIGELGIIGTLILLWLIISMLKGFFSIYRNSIDDYSGGLALGLLCGFSGLLVLGVAANVFVIVRISEPLWFLSACVMMLPRFTESMELPSEKLEDVT